MTGLDGILARLALSMGPGGAEIGGENVRLEQEPENGLELRITILDDDGRPRSIASAFSPSEDRPPAFPPGIPFVPATATHIIDDQERGLRLALWQVEGGDGEAVERVFERVVAQSREAGWTLEERSAGRSARLTLEDRRRRVEAGTGAGGAGVSMAERITA